MANLNANHKTIELINSSKNKEKIRVLFVCLGNICRSPAAEGVMRAVVERNDASDKWTIDSAGTGGWHVGDLPDKRMRVHAIRRGYDLTHICRQVKSTDFDNFDIIIGMDDNNISDLKRLAPTVEDECKIVPMADFVDKAMRCHAIPDPYYEGAEGFELVLDLLESACENLFRQVNSDKA